ncbi:MAG: glycosyltransferase family 2 protein, partial [Pseudomonadota bacterium]
AYHRLLGFDNICVYTNDCSDGTDAMLDRLEEMGEVRHFRNDVPEGRKPQPQALSLAEANPAVTKTDWLLVMDADEFLNVKCGDGTVDALLAAVPDWTDAINITWRFFGSSGVTGWNEGLVTETFTRAAPDAFKKGWGVKTLFRPFEHLKLGIHRPHIRGAKKDPERPRALAAQRWVNGSGVEMAEDFKLSGWRSTKPTLGYDLVELNHYAVKSYEAYLLRRMRGNVNNKEDKYNANYFAIFDRNEIEVRGAADRAARVRALMDEWLRDPKLARLQSDALAYHSERVEALRATGEYDDWIAQLKEAGGKSVAELETVLFTLHLPKRYQEVVKHLRAKGVPDALIAKMINAQSTGRKAATRAALGAVAEGEEAEPAGDAPAESPEDAALSPEDLADAILSRISGTKKLTRAIARAQAGGQARVIAPKARDTLLSLIQQRPVTPTPRVRRPETLGDGRRIVVTTMKNEGPYILEWIAHYLEIGFDGFAIYSNDCTDGTNLILNRLDAMGIVQHFDNPLGPRMDPQRRAYSRAGQLSTVRAASWVLVADADEFLNIHTGDGTVDALLDAVPADTDAVSVNWRLFGSGGAAEMDATPVTRRFTRASGTLQPENGLVWGFKTLFRPQRFDYFGVHRPRFHKTRQVPDDAVMWVNAAGQPMGKQYLRSGWRSNERVVAYDFAQVNHYAVKSRA